MNVILHITFKGLSTTFEASTNDSFTDISHIYSLLVITCLPAKCLLLIRTKAVRHTCNCIVQSLKI